MSQSIMASELEPVTKVFLDLEILKKLNGFDRGEEPERILTTVRFCKVETEETMLLVLVKFKNKEDCEIVPYHLVRKKCPRLLIKYYEENLKFPDDAMNM